MKHCYVCLRSGHWSNACPNRKNAPCLHCDNPVPHHVALCHAVVYRRPGRTSPAPAQSPSPQGGSEALRSTQKKTVNWSRDLLPAASNVRHSSAPSSPKDNSKDNRRKQSKNKKTKGTGSSGRGGAPRPLTASAAESTLQQDVRACDGAGLLAGHQSLLQTDRRLNQEESTQSRHTDRQQWLDYLAACEELSTIESIGRCDDSDIDLDDAEWYPDDSGYAVSTSSPPDTQAVILECVKATAVNPHNGASQEVTVFFDSGSTKSYVSKQLARDLDLPQREKQVLHINTFAATTTTALEGFETSLVLRSQQGHSVSVDAMAADNIVRSVRTAFVTSEEIPQLRKNNCALVSTRETPDLLIGQDRVHLFKRRREGDLPNGCYFVQTILGPMVGGAGQVIFTIPRDVNAHVADSDGKLGTLCRPSTMGPVDILDRSTPMTGRGAQPTSSMTRTTPILTKPELAHTASDGPHRTTYGPTPEEDVFSYAYGLAEKTSDAELIGDFSYLENAGIGTNEMKPDDQTAADMLKSMHRREKDGRYKVPLLFRTATGAPPSNAELPTNAPLAKGRAISTRNSLIKAPDKLKNYDGIIKDYEKRDFIGKAPRFTPYPKHCLSHHPVFKETSTTTATRPVFDASAKLPGRPCLNDWVFRGPVLLPVVPAILLRSRFPIIIIVCDIGKAFLQMSVQDSHRDCLRFYWFKDPFAEPTEDNIIEYRFNRVPFGLKSSPYLLAGVIKMHLEQEGTPLALEMLKNCYVDNVLLMADNVNEALQKYRESKATFAKIQMPLREYASNNAQFNNAINPEDRAELEKLRELVIRWDVTADYWDLPLMPKPPSKPTHSVGDDTLAATDTPAESPAHSVGPSGPVPSKKVKRKRGKKSDDGRLTKRTMLRFVAQIFDPLGLVQAAILLLKLVIQEVWKIEKDWDDDIPAPLAQLWEEAIRDFDKTTIRIPRRISKGKIKSAEIHVFTDGSSQAYGFTAYLRVKESDGSYSTNLVYCRAKVKPIKDAEKYTIPRMELLGVLIGARAAKFLYEEISVDITAVHLWSDSTIVLHQVADNEKIKEVFVENRLKEIRQIRDQLGIHFRHVPTDDNPADIASRGLAAAELQHCAKWWFGAPFLSHDERHWPKQPTSLGEGAHSVPDPKSDLEHYGGETFAALYAEVFTPTEQVTNRRFRPRKKENPLDTITKPLPPTTVSANVLAAMDPEAHSATRSIKLPAISLLPAAIEDKYPVWTRQVRITYYVIRFSAACLRRLRQKSRPNSHDQHAPSTNSALGFDLAENFKSSRPTLGDLNLTEMIILRKTQLRHPPSSPDQRNLGIFEYQGLLYVKGRLGNMKLRPTALTPLYLPRKARETELIIMDYHRNNCHSGVTATLANIRMRFWFTRGRQTIQHAIYKNCFPCRRETLHPYASPAWPQLPASRVTRSRPFLFTGLDCGPCYLRTPQTDGTFHVQKHYVAIFVCMTYRCVHLELCSDLSTQEFLHALRRFGSRREFPARILSDNGSSFLTAREVIECVHRATAPSRPHIRRNPVRKAVSARLAATGAPAHSAGAPQPPTPQPSTGRRALRTAHSADPSAANAFLTPEEEQLIDFCQRHKIEWQTITELSPWKGGSYERLIGLIKHCLRRSIGRTKPTVVEFSSLLADSEHTANSRPLTYIADSETDFFLVRPLDFIHPLLRDEALQTPLDPPVDAEADPNDPDFIAPGENKLHGIIKDLKRARQQADLFWEQFRDGYLAELRSRGVNSKRRQYGEPNIHPGDLVLVYEPNVPRCFWRFALVLEVLPCDDGEIRSARVRFSKTHQEHTRSLAHLYPIGNIPRISLVTMGNTLYSTSMQPDAAENQRSVDLAHSVGDTLQADPITDTTISQASVDPAHPVGDTEQATDSVATYGSTTPISETSTPEDPADAALETTAQNVAMHALRTPQDSPAQHVADLMALADKHDAHIARIGPSIAAGIQAIEQTSDDHIRRVIFTDVSTAVIALVDAAPRADRDDQAENNSAGSANSSRRGSFARKFRGAFSSRAPTRTSEQPQTATTSRPAPPQAFPVSRDAPKPPTDVWNTIAADNATAAKERQATTAASARRGRGQGGFGPLRNAAMVQRPSTSAAAMQTSTVPDDDPWSVPDTEPWGTTAQADPTHSVGGATATQAASATTASQQDQRNHLELIPTKPTFDPATLPAYPSLETIKRDVLQHFSFESGPQGQRLATVDDNTLASGPIREPQDTGFWLNYHCRTPEHMNVWDPVTLCYGRDEDRSHFHQSIRVHRLIIKTTWTKFRQLAERQDMLHMLDKLLNLRILSFGQMILLEFAVRISGDHDRMSSIVQFLYDMLRVTDTERDLPRIINRYHAWMTQGLRTTDAFPTDADLRKAAIHWLCYCHKAFVFFLTHLSGRIVWNVEWLQSKDLNRDFRRAVSDNILMKAHNVLQDVRRLVYQQYVLRRIHALETGDDTYAWKRLDEVLKAKEIDESFQITSTTIGETVIFMAQEIFSSAFVKTMQKDGILLNQIPSSNRTDVLNTVRRFFPGPMTKRVVFWLGQTYIFNGNQDYGQLIADLCHHYTTTHGRISQCVILPAYDRTHRAVWTSEVLCLYLQKGLIVPHAQVVLHPYDVRLWQADQPAAERGDAAPLWTNRHQSAEGHIYKLSAVEARKYNMRLYHNLDLWTWYMQDHPGEPPPPELFEQRRQPNFRPHGDALAAQLAAQANQAPAAVAVAHSASVTIQTSRPRNSTPAVPAEPSTPAAPAAQSIPAPLPIPPTQPPTPSTTTDQLTTSDLATELVNRMLTKPVLQSLVESAAQQAVSQVSATLDAKLGRIEELLMRRAGQDSQPTTSAEHRHQDSGSSA